MALTLLTSHIHVPAPAGTWSFAGKTWVDADAALMTNQPRGS
jgi:hypothetical protein